MAQAKTNSMNEQSLHSQILVIEDDEHIAYLLEFILQREGYTTVRAADGRAAAQLCESTSPPPLLVLLDVMLPYQDGFQLISMIRANPEWKDVPVIMLSAKSHERDIVRALEAGVNDYVLKPFQPNELLARVRRFLKAPK